MKYSLAASRGWSLDISNITCEHFLTNLKVLPWHNEDKGFSKKVNMH